MSVERPKDVTRRVVVDLKKVEGEIPRNAAGDPAFEVLTHTTMGWFEEELEKNEGALPSLLGVFKPEQIVALCNRALYQMEYSRKAHRDRSQELRDRERPVREAFKTLYPNVSWANATEEQIKAAVNAVYQPKGDQNG